ncbi:hypothetical protein Tco_0099395 [Tanacetum coccineum]
MATANVPAENALAPDPPVRSDDQILPYNSWLQSLRSTFNNSGILLGMIRRLESLESYLISYQSVPHGQNLQEKFIHAIDSFITDKKNMSVPCKAEKGRAVAEAAEPSTPKAKTAKVTKPKATKQPAPKASKPKTTSSKPPKPKPAPTKPSKDVPEKKQKLVKETPDEPSPAKRSKGGLGKGKEKIIDEQVAKTLLDINSPKKKSTTDQYILQRRTPETVEPMGTSSQPEDKGITMSNSEMKFDEVVTHVNKEKDASYRELTEINTGVQDEGQARLKPDEDFTTTAYPSVQENLKLPTGDQVILEEPTSSTRTSSSLQNLDKELSFTNQFFVKKPHSGGKVEQTWAPSVQLGESQYSPEGEQST